MSPKWAAFWQRVLSPQTARFILAVAALALAGVGAFILLGMTGESEHGEASVFAVGQLFALASIAFGYYFGSTARNDERPPRITQEAMQPEPEEPSQ